MRDEEGGKGYISVKDGPAISDRELPLLKKKWTLITPDGFGVLRSISVSRLGRGLGSHTKDGPPFQTPAGRPMMQLDSDTVSQETASRHQTAQLRAQT